MSNTFAHISSTHTRPPFRFGTARSTASNPPAVQRAPPACHGLPTLKFSRAELMSGSRSLQRPRSSVPPSPLPVTPFCARLTRHFRGHLSHTCDYARPTQNLHRSNLGAGVAHTHAQPHAAEPAYMLRQPVTGAARWATSVSSSSVAATASSTSSRAFFNTAMSRSPFASSSATSSSTTVVVSSSSSSPLLSSVSSSSSSVFAVWPSAVFASLASASTSAWSLTHTRGHKTLTPVSNRAKLAAMSSETRKRSKRIGTLGATNFSTPTNERSASPQSRAQYLKAVRERERVRRVHARSPSNRKPGQPELPPHLRMANTVGENQSGTHDDGRPRERRTTATPRRTVPELSHTMRPDLLHDFGLIEGEQLEGRPTPAPGPPKRLKYDPVQRASWIARRGPLPERRRKGFPWLVPGEDHDDEWRCKFGTVLQRCQVITKELTPAQKERDALRERMAKLKRRHVPDDFWDTMDPQGKDSKSHVEGDEIKPPYIPAPRRTEADRSGDRRTNNRRLDENLFLIIKKRETAVNGSYLWRFPEGDAVDNMTARRSSVLNTRSIIGRKLMLHTMGNAPLGYYRHTYDDEAVPVAHRRSAKHKGTKLFLYHALVIEQYADKLDIDMEKHPDIVDWAWVAKDEMPEYFNADMCELLDDILWSQH